MCVALFRLDCYLDFLGGVCEPSVHETDFRTLTADAEKAEIWEPYHATLHPQQPARNTGRPPKIGFTTEPLRELPPF